MGDDAAVARCDGEVESEECGRLGDTAALALDAAGVRGGEATFASLVLAVSGLGARGCVKRRDIADASTGSDGSPFAAGKGVLVMALKVAIEVVQTCV